MNMTQIIHIADLTDPYDKRNRTYRELNNLKKHKIPIGTLVEVKFEDSFGGEGGWKVHARLWIIKHTRDCDGTPLYTLSRWDPAKGSIPGYGDHYGFNEESLKSISNDSLSWEENE